MVAEVEEVFQTPLIMNIKPTKRKIHDQPDERLILTTKRQSIKAAKLRGDSEAAQSYRENYSADAHSEGFDQDSHDSEDEQAELSQVSRPEESSEGEGVIEDEKSSDNSDVSEVRIYIQ